MNCVKTLIASLLIVAGLNQTHGQAKSSVTLPSCNSMATPVITAQSVSVQSATAASVTLEWSNVGATSYGTFRKAPGGVIVTAGCSTGLNGVSCATSGFTPGNSYQVYVTASRACRVSSTETDTDVKTSPLVTLTLQPPTPTGIATSAVTPTSLVMSWNAANGATSYQVDVSTSSTFLSGFNASINTNSVAVDRLTPSTTYFARVRAVNAGGASSYQTSTIASANLPIPAPPTNLVASSVASNSFVIGWTASTNATSYSLDVSTSNLFSTENGYSNVTVTVNGTTQAVADLLPLTTYYCRVRAVNASGTSANSVTSAAIVTPPTTPVVSYDLLHMSSFTATCNEVPRANAYFFEVSTDQNFSTFAESCKGTIAAPVPSFIVDGLSPGTSYFVRARAAVNTMFSEYSVPLQVLTPSVDTHIETGSSDTPFKVNVIAPSPEAAALAKYADVPVSLYSGTPGISVPLYDIKHGDLSLPIALSYNASGNKVEGSAPWTGLSWSLSAGGVVTRVVRGGWPDEHDRGFLRLASQYHSYGGIRDLSDVDKAALYRSLAEGCRDGEPDLFYFNFHGYSGQFMYDWNGQIKLFSGNNIKINPINFNNPGTYGDFIDGWEFTTDDGTIYKFFAMETTAIVTDPYETGSICNYLQEVNQAEIPQAWYMTEMTSANKFHSITFDYTSYTIINESLASENKVHNQALAEEFTSSGGQHRLKTTSHGKHLKKITAGLTIVKFESSSVARTDLLPGSFDFPLSYVEVTDLSGKQIRKWDFEYNYSTNRLTLGKITERAGSMVKPPYIFEYNGSLPAESSFKVDHWGFYNDNRAGTFVPAIRQPRLLPPFTVIALPGADRSPDAQMVLEGMLTRITYPTGGKDVFTFESHDYSFEQAVPLMHRETSSMHVGISAPTASNNSATETFTINSGPVDINITSILGWGIAFGGGAPSVSLTGPSGQLIYHLALGVRPTNDCRCSTHEEVISNLPAGTYTMTVDGNVMMNGGERQVNTAGMTVGWDEPSGVAVPETRIGGGVRIKRIVRSFGNGSPDQVTRYDYTFMDNGQRKSSGSLLESGYVYAAQQFYAKPIHVEGIGRPYEIIPKLARFAQNRSALGSTQGSHVGYSHVTVLHGENGENGKTTYRYDSPREILDFTTEVVPFPPAMSQDYARGLMLEQNDFGATDTTRAVHSAENAYNYFDNDIFGLKIGWKVIGAPTVVNGDLDLFAVGLYTNRSGYTRLKQSKERLIKDGTAFETIHKFKYAETSHKQLIEAWTANSKGDTIVSAQKYPLDYTSPDPAIQKMIDNHMLNVPVEKLVWRKESDSQVSLLSAMKTDFKISGAAVMPSVTQSARITSPVLTSDPYGLVAGLYEPRLKVNTYDDDKPAEVVESDGRITSYLYGYLHMLPVAKADNAALSQIFYTGFEEAGTAEKKAGIGSLQISGGPYSIPDFGRPRVNGNYILSWWTKTGSSPWVYNERLIQNYVAGTSISTDVVNGFIDEVRLYPQGALMTTLTYDPLVGATSTTDPANRTTYYEYDDFGRLKYVRDQDRNIVQSHDYQFKANVGYQTPAPDITTFSPATGAIGSSVTISGTNFGIYTAYNDVKLNGISADIISASSTQLIVRVPAGVTSGKLTVTVNNNSASSSKDFTVTNP